MEQNPSGFDPKNILKSASSNVISSFCLNESYDFGDSEQMQILQWTERFLENFRGLYLIYRILVIYLVGTLLPSCLYVVLGFLLVLLSFPTSFDL